MRKKRSSDIGRDGQELLVLRKALVLGSRHFWNQSGHVPERAADRATRTRKLDAAGAVIMFGVIVEHVVLILAAVWLRWYWLLGLLVAGDAVAAFDYLRLMRITETRFYVYDKNQDCKDQVRTSDASYRIP